LPIALGIALGVLCPPLGGILDSAASSRPTVNTKIDVFTPQTGLGVMLTKTRLADLCFIAHKQMAFMDHNEHKYEVPW
jgi:hypothetical protein